MHLSCKTIQFENLMQAQIQQVLSGVKDDEVKIIVLRPEKLAPIWD